MCLLQIKVVTHWNVFWRLCDASVGCEEKQKLIKGSGRLAVDASATEEVAVSHQQLTFYLFVFLTSKWCLVVDILQIVMEHRHNLTWCSTSGVWGLLPEPGTVGRDVVAGWQWAVAYGCVAVACTVREKDAHFGCAFAVGPGNLERQCFTSVTPDGWSELE